MPRVEGRAQVHTLDFVTAQARAASDSGAASVVDHASALLEYDAAIKALSVKQVRQLCGHGWESGGVDLWGLYVMNALVSEHVVSCLRNPMSSFMVKCTERGERERARERESFIRSVTRGRLPSPLKATAWAFLPAVKGRARREPAEPRLRGRCPQ